MRFAMPIASLFAKPVVTVNPQTPLRTAAALMREHNVGALVVVSTGHRTVGIITDRDIALALCEQGFSITEPVQQVMGCPVETLRTEDGVYEATRRMMELGVRRLPVVNGKGRLAGLVTLDDLLLMLSRTLQQVAEGIQPAPPIGSAPPTGTTRPAAAGPRRRG